VTKEQIAAFSSLPRSPDNFRMTDPSELTGGARLRCGKDSLACCRGWGWTSQLRSTAAIYQV
jgi:hypothetical protein